MEYICILLLAMQGRYLYVAFLLGKRVEKCVISYRVET